MEHNKLLEKYPPSAPCDCQICRYFCNRPGWWSVDQARMAIRCGVSDKMMMEIAPEKTFAVLSPAFRGNEGRIAENRFAGNGCCFLQDTGCVIHDSIYYPLECGFCHHNRIGMGISCHAELENDWNTQRGQALVFRWCEILQYYEGLQWAEIFYEKYSR